MVSDSDEWKRVEWGREVIVNLGACGFAMLPMIDGNTPESLVKDVHLLAVFKGDKGEVEAHFERLRAFHVGQPAGWLALVCDEQERKVAEYGGQ